MPKPNEKQMNNLKVLRANTIQGLTVQESDDEYIIEGYALLFETETAIGGDWFYESIARGSISDEALEDVLFFTNHDSNKITLARSRRNNANSSLQLSVDEKGLFFRTKLDVNNNPEAAALYSAVKRGDIDGMSFLMLIQNQEWRDLDSDMPHRKITKISKIFEISAVNWPAYENTEISARANVDSLDNDKMALDNAKSGALDNALEFELARRKLLFKVKKTLGGIKP